MNGDPEPEPDPHVGNPLATVNVFMHAGYSNLRLSSDLDAPPPIDPCDSRADQADFEAAFLVVFPSIEKGESPCLLN